MSANYLEIFTLLALIAALNLPHHHLNSSTWSPSGRIALAVLILILTGWNLVYPVELAWADHQFGKAVDQILAKQEVEAAKTMIAADKINPHQGYLFQLSAQIMMTLASKNPNKTFYLDTAHFLVDQGQLFYAEDYQYYLLKGKIAVLSGDAVQSQKYFVRAAELAPNLSQVYLEWSQSCVQLKDYACFAAQLEKYLQLIPDYWKKGRDLNRQSPEDHDKFRIFLKENPSFWNLVEALQMYYSISGNSVQSSYYQKILQ
jgi:tetratricopeptide (TPR) repeat protein